MDREEHIGRRIACLARQVDRAIGKETSKYGISSIQGKIIGYLFYETKECKREVFQKDIEENFGIRRSSVSSVLDKLEKGGYILRKSCEKDARLKEIELTEEGINMNNLICGSISKVENILHGALSEAELNFFLEIIGRLSKEVDN